MSAEEYRKMIVCLLDKIADEKTLKKIFEYAHSQFIRK